MTKTYTTIIIILITWGIVIPAFVLVWRLDEMARENLYLKSEIIKADQEMNKEWNAKRLEAICICKDDAVTTSIKCCPKLKF